MSRCRDATGAPHECMCDSTHVVIGNGGHWSCHCFGGPYYYANTPQHARALHAATIKRKQSCTGKKSGTA